jgi:hypothetical protein
MTMDLSVLTHLWAWMWGNLAAALPFAPFFFVGETTDPPADPIQNPDDYRDTSSSYSSGGLPKWATKLLQPQMGKYLPGSLKAYLESIQGLQHAPAMIEAIRKSRNVNYNREIQQPTMQAVNTGIRTLTGRGALNSSTAGDFVSRMTQNALQGAAGQEARSGEWAAGARINNLSEMVRARQGFAGMLGDLLGLTRYTSGGSNSRGGLPWDPGGKGKPGK